MLETESSLRSAPEPQQLTTGIAALDQLLGGGIPHRQVVLLAGQPGSGKTILASQIAFAQAARGTPVLMATAASEPHTKILESLRNFSFFERERVGREILLLSVYPWLRRGVRETREMLLSSVRERRARLLVIDGLRSLRDVWRDESSIREFLAELGVGLASNDCTGVLALESAPETVLEMPEAATVDGVVSLYFERDGMRRKRRVEVVKLRGRDHLSGEHAARLGLDGFEIHVRLEAERQPERAHAAVARKAGFGVASLDAWLGGGLPGGTTTVLAGSTGTGKTLLGYAFARAGALAGEPSLFVSFEEATEALEARTRTVSLDLPDGAPLEVMEADPLGLEPDEQARGVIERARSLGAKRIVIDGIELLEQAMAPTRRWSDFSTAFIRRLTHGGRDVLLTYAGSASGSVLARRADNLLEVELQSGSDGSWRELRALKIRAAASPGRVCRFEFTASGFAAQES